MGCSSTHEKQNNPPEDQKSISEINEIKSQNSQNSKSKNSKISSQNHQSIDSSQYIPRKYNKKRTKEEQDNEFKKYQNEIKKSRNDENSISSSDSEEKRNKRKLGLYHSIIDAEISQEEKEERKRKYRMQFIPPLQKEVPFRHREEEEIYDPNDIDSKPFKLGYEDEIYNGKNYGIPIQIYNQTWLTYDFPVEPDVKNPRVEIPLGWRIPYKKDYEELIKFAESNERAKIVLTHEKLLNMNEDFVYITSDKVYSDEFDGYKNDAWKFYCVGFNRDDDDDDNDDNDDNDEEKKNEEKKKKDGYDVIMKEQSEYEYENDIVNMKGDNYSKDEILDTDFKKKINDRIKRNKNNNKPSKVNVKKLKNKKPNTPNLKAKMITDDNEIELIFGNNQEIIFQKLEGEREKNENKIKKLIFKIDTFKNKKILKCKLIANQVLDIMFKCPLVIEQGYKAFFEVPNVTNITTFEWDFNDKYCNKKQKKSDKLIASHIFNKTGEYIIKLHIILFSCRSFHLEKKVLVIDEILFGNEEIINGISYGQPIKIGNQIWLDRDLVNYHNHKGKDICLIRGKGPGIHGENSFLDSVSACPKGWRLPYKEEIEEMLDYVGRNDEQKLFFLTLMDGAFLAEVKEGIYDLICMNFKNSNSSYQSLKDEKKDKERIESILNNNYELNQKLKNYNRLLVGTLNFNDIYKKEAYCLNISNNHVSIGTRTTSLNSPFSMFSTRCIRDQEINLDLGISDNSFPINFKIEFKLDYPNIEECKWDFGDGSKVIKNELEVSHSYSKSGEYNLNCIFTVFYNVEYTVTKHLQIYSDDDFEDTELVNESQIKIYNLGKFYKVKRINEIHFSRSIAPISPLINEIGFYIAFNDILDNEMKLFKISFEDTNQLFLDCFTNPIYTCYSGIPYDLSSTKNGVVILMGDTRDNNLLFIQFINSKGEMIWRNNIMQNGPNPLKPEKNQLLFINSESNKIEFGMNAMFNPLSGRLSYGYGRILCVFSYMNCFGLTKNGEREDNNGDTVVTYSEDGSQVHLVQSWSTTHSLCQRCVFNGKYFYECSFGDCAPANIKVMRIDPRIQLKLDVKNKKNSNLKTTKLNLSNNSTFNNNSNNNYQPEIKFEHYLPLQNRIKNNKDLINTNNDFEFNEYDYLKNLDNFKKSEHMTMNLRNKYLRTNIVNGSIPSNLRGQTSGRLGDITKIRNDKFAIIYSRIPCIDGGEVNKVNELSCIIFDNELKVNEVNIIREGDLVNCIKNAKYGNNIFVMISESKKFTNDKKYLLDKVDFIEEEIEEDHEICNCFLLDNNGKLIGNNILSYPINIFSPSDDFETLIDGSVVWTFSDNDNNLYLCILGVSEMYDFLNNYKNDFISSDKVILELSKKDEDAIKEKEEKEKEILREMGIDDEEIQRKIKESQKIEKRKLYEDSEEMRIAEEEEKEKELEKERKKKEEERILKELEEEKAMRKKERLKKENEQKKLDEEWEDVKKKKKKKKPKIKKKTQPKSENSEKKKKKGYEYESSESYYEEEEEESDDNKKRIKNKINMENMPEFKIYGKNLIGKNNEEQNYDNYYM